MNETSNIKDLVSLTMAGRIIGAARMTVYRLIDRGELPQPERIGGLPFLPRDAVDRVASDFKKKRSGK